MYRISKDLDIAALFREPERRQQKRFNEDRMILDEPALLDPKIYDQIESRKT